MDLDAVDLIDPALYLTEGHHEVFAELRRRDPVHWQPGRDGGGFWNLTRHADVVAANRDAATFSSARGFTVADWHGPSAEATGDLLLGMDAPKHTRQRRLVSRGFTPRVLARLEDHLEARSRAIVDAVIDREACDFVTDVAAELPLQAIADLMGIPQEDRYQVFEWSNRLIGFDDPEYAEDPAKLTAAAEMYGYADALRRDRLAQPRDDIVTTLTQALDGDELTDAEFSMFFILLAVAGNETTRNATAHGLRALIEHPDQWAALARDPSRPRLERAVEEILRWASPVLHFRRTATRDVEVGGRTIRAGDKVLLWYPSANRDETVFPDPFRFDVERWPNEQVAFGGGGPHFCLGANLARLELRLIFTQLITRWGEVRSDGPAEMLRSNLVGGIKHLPVRWTVRERDAVS
jgi:cholest-4-en-3-one 26-monooxygenase